MIEEQEDLEPIEVILGFGAYIKQVVRSNGDSIKAFVAKINTSEYGQRYFIKENRIYKILEDRRIPSTIEYTILIEVSGADPNKAYRYLRRYMEYAISMGIIGKTEKEDE